MPLIKRNQALPHLCQSIKPRQSIRQFEHTIIGFHNAHNTPIRQFPYIFGKRINLKKLYIAVIKRGGYKKVNENNDWDDVLEDLNIPTETTNGEFAIQSIYHRYLEDYEREQWNSLSNSLNSNSGHDNSNDGNSNLSSSDLDLSKHSSLISELAVKDKSFLAMFVNDNMPKIYCDYQHVFCTATRNESKLSSDLKDFSEMKQITMSLMSGLTNEIELALNTLLILSNTNQVNVDLGFVGNLVDLLMANVGIFHAGVGSYYEQFKNFVWMKQSLQFWNTMVEDGVGRMFLIPNIFHCTKNEFKRLQRTGFVNSNNKTRSDSSSKKMFNDDHLEYNHITDGCVHRIHLVATIIYNLIIESVSNSRFVANHLQCLRFLFLGAHSRDAVLRRIAVQSITKMRFVLYPITYETEKRLEKLPGGLIVDMDAADDDNDNFGGDDDDDYDDDWFSQFLLDFLNSLLHSDDRFDRLSAYDMVQTLCLIEENHEILSNQLQSRFISTISSQLLIPDIHPLCCALEALVSLSQLGDDMCRRMAMCRQLLSILIQYIQIEAQMFGPSAVYKIKTFNYRPPIPVANLNPLPQVVRFPHQTPIRPQPPPPMLTQFTSNNPLTNQALNPVNFPPNCNSISPQCLSRLPQRMIRSPQPPCGIITKPNNSIQQLPINPSFVSSCSSNVQVSLTPLQQIDHLLTRSLASFETPTPKSNKIISAITNHPPAPPYLSICSMENNRNNENAKIIRVEDRTETIIPKQENNNSIILQNDTKYTGVEECKSRRSNGLDKKVVKIKCCVDALDLDDEDNNNKDCVANKENGVKDNGNDGEGNISEQSMMNGDCGIMERRNGDGYHEDDLKQQVPMENEELEDPKPENESENDNEYKNEEHDRQQMPPPSLPTPSMLKRQLSRPATKLSPPSSQNAVSSGGGLNLGANGYLSHLNSRVKRLLDSEMTSNTNAQIENRCDRAKIWLRKHFRFSDDSKMFIPKQELVNELHLALFEEEKDDELSLVYDSKIGLKRIFSVHELHSCIKEVFNGKVQVKVEHGPNGTSQLIYSNLCRINDAENGKPIPNGIVNSIIESNGFVKIPVAIKRRRLGSTHSTIVNTQPANNKSVRPKPNKIVASIRKTRLQKYWKSRKRVSPLKKATLKPDKFLQSDIVPTLPDHVKGVVNFCQSDVPRIETMPTNSQQSVTNPISIFTCLWEGCGISFSDQTSLQSHISSHVPHILESDQLRIFCRWKFCSSSTISRAPLSLLSHILDEHVSKFNSHTPFEFLPPKPTIIDQNVMISPHHITHIQVNPPSFINPVLLQNRQTPPPQVQHISEKSGWSVLLDHFRVEESMNQHLPEGPITKHIRISSSIILRNMSRHSIIAKQFLRKNERILSQVAISNQDCAPIIVQCLDELNISPITDSSSGS